MGLRTIILKIHKPGRNKREILEQAMLNYNEAFRYLLDSAFTRLGQLQENLGENQKRFSSLILSKWVDKDMSRELNRFDVQPFKDSLKLDFGMTMASYFSLQAAGERVSFPKASSSDSDMTIYSVSNKNGSGPAGASRLDKLRPIYFCRYDLKRCYCLLYNSATNRYFAKLHLLNGSQARPASGSGGESEKLTYVHNKRGMLERNGKKETFIIVPLSFGRWQEAILQKALEKPETLRTAKLLYRKGDFYLAVSIDTGERERLGTTAFLGVSRGLKNSLNYTLVDPEGEILDTGAIRQNSGIVSRRNVPLNQLHEAANKIIGIALENKAQVIVQNLSEKGDRINWVDNKNMNYQPHYKCHDYNQLTRLLDYKLPEKGLPPPVRVSSVYIFYTCPECGWNSRQNRLTRDMFICTNCGSTVDVDSLGGLNLARRLIHYHHSPIKIKVVETPQGVTFINPILGLNCYSTRMENPIEKLKSQILDIIQDITEKARDSNDKELIRKFSLIRKMNNSENLMNSIEFV